MFHIESDAEVVTGGVTYCVLQGGDFEECDLVEVYRHGDETKLSIGAFQACFVKYGYNFGENQEGG
jgi:hypothetical protein